MTEKPANQDMSEEIAARNDDDEFFIDEHSEQVFESIFEETSDQTLLAGETLEDLNDELDDFTLTNNQEPPVDRLSLQAQVEAIVFASPKCIRPGEIQELMQDPNVTVTMIEEALTQLCEEYRERAGGFTLESIRGHGYQFRTVQAAGPLMERMFASRPRPISRAALETLAIVAYRQPVTRADIEFIRGVDSGSIVKNLLERDLIKCVGRKEDAGRPMMFGTSDEFLNVFRLSSLKDLPPLSSFQPNQDTMRQALQQLSGEASENDESLMTDDFVSGDDDSPAPNVSGGLVDEQLIGAELEISDESMLDASSEVESIETTDEIQDTDGRAGASVAFTIDEEIPGDNRGDQTEQMAVPDGDSLEEDGRPMDKAGTD